jgi:hypothetical protein
LFQESDVKGASAQLEGGLQSRRPGRSRWLLWVCAIVLVLVIAGALTVEWGMRQLQPMMRRKVVETLSIRFHSPVELDNLSLSMTKDIVVTGSGLRILYLAGPTEPNARPNAPPMLTVRSFEFRTELRELLRPTTRVLAVKVDGLQVNIPPSRERGVHGSDDSRKAKQPAMGLLVDRIDCTDTKLMLETSVPGKMPLEFDIGSLVLTEVGANKPFKYQAVLVNPKPVGEVRSTGNFGPWQKDNPRDTPLDGDYQFTHADLSSIHGIAGILASTGRFFGTLGNIAVDGVADVPNFRLDVSDHGQPLHTQFHAIVDGTTGDTRLDPVQARIGHSDVLVTGSVISTAGVKGHRTELSAEMKHGRLEDMQTLTMRGNPTPMRGTLTWKAHILIPPGPVSISRKMSLQGTFAIHNAFVNNPKMQAQLDSLSERAQGKPKFANVRDAAVVGSSATGGFEQANAVISLKDVVYQMPGAQMKMNGQVNMVDSTYEFHGVVRTQATASQMMTGWKSLLARPFDKLLKKNGAGLELPIKVTGTKSTYDLHLDFPHNTRGPGALQPPVQ